MSGAKPKPAKLSEIEQRALERKEKAALIKKK